MNYENYPAHLKGAVDYLIDGLGGMGERIVAVLTIMIDQLAHKYALDYEVSNVAQRRDVLEKVVDVVERYPDLTEQHQFDILDFAESHYIWKIDLVRVRLAGTRELSPVEALLGRLNTGFLTIKSTNVPELADVGFDQLCRAFEVSRRGRSFASTRGEEYAGRGNRDDDRYDGNTRAVIFGRRSIPLMELGQSLHRPVVDDDSKLRVVRTGRGKGDIQLEGGTFVSRDALLNICDSMDVELVGVVSFLKEATTRPIEFIRQKYIYPRTLCGPDSTDVELAGSTYLQFAFEETARMLLDVPGRSRPMGDSSDITGAWSDEELNSIQAAVFNKWGIGETIVDAWITYLPRNVKWLKWLGSESDNVSSASDLIYSIAQLGTGKPLTLEAVLAELDKISENNENLADSISILREIVKSTFESGIGESSFIMQFGPASLYRALMNLKAQM